jgi:hypothetical protein
MRFQFRSGRCRAFFALIRPFEPGVPESLLPIGSRRSSSSSRIRARLAAITSAG